MSEDDEILERRERKGKEFLERRWFF